jgi:hypothetical protein
MGSETGGKAGGGLSGGLGGYKVDWRGLGNSVANKFFQ